MAEDWAAEALSVYNDFVKEGFSLMVRTPGDAGVFNPVTLEYDGAVAATDVGTYGLKKNYRIDQIDGTIIQLGDIILVLPAYGMSRVTTENKIVLYRNTWDEIYGDSWEESFGAAWDGEASIAGVRVIDPGNVPLIYECQVRVIP